MAEAREVLANLLEEREPRLERRGELESGRLSSRHVRLLIWSAGWETNSARCESASGFTAAEATEGSGGRAAMKSPAN